MVSRIGLFSNVYNAGHFRMGPTTVGEAADFREFPLIEFIRKYIVRFFFTQRLEPHVVVLAFLTVLPAHCFSALDRDFLCDELEVLDNDEVLVTTRSNPLAKKGQENYQ